MGVRLQQAAGGRGKRQERPWEGRGEALAADPPFPATCPCVLPSAAHPSPLWPMQVPEDFGPVRTVAEGRGDTLYVGTTRNSILHGSAHLGFSLVVQVSICHVLPDLHTILLLLPECTILSPVSSLFLSHPHQAHTLPFPLPAPAPWLIPHINPTLPELDPQKSPWVCTDTRVPTVLPLQAAQSFPLIVGTWYSFMTQTPDQALGRTCPSHDHALQTTCPQHGHTHTVAIPFAMPTSWPATECRMLWPCPPSRFNGFLGSAFFSPFTSRLPPTAPSNVKSLPTPTLLPLCGSRDVSGASRIQRGKSPGGG